MSVNTDTGVADTTGMETFTAARSTRETERGRERGTGTERGGTEKGKESPG